MPNIIRSIQEMQPYQWQMPPLQTMNLTQVINSVVGCRLCMTNGIVDYRSRIMQTDTFTKCPFCNGSREMSNRESTYEH